MWTRNGSLLLPPGCQSAAEIQAQALWMGSGGSMVARLKLKEKRRKRRSLMPKNNSSSKILAYRVGVRTFKFEMPVSCRSTCDLIVSPSEGCGRLGCAQVQDVATVTTRVSSLGGRNPETNSPTQT